MKMIFQQILVIWLMIDLWKLIKKDLFHVEFDDFQMFLNYV